MSCQSTDLAFHCDHSGRSTVYYKKSTLPFDSKTRYFIRGWAPSEDASTLLAIIARQAGAVVHDVIANTSHEIRTSKLAQPFLLASSKVYFPNTWVIPLKSFASYQARAVRELSFPLVLKARGGAGQRVWLCQNRNDLVNHIKRLKNEAKDDLVLLQEYLHNQGDIRVIVYRGAVLAAVTRRSADGFLNNVSQGGQATPAHITNEERRLAIRATKVLGLDLGGVDIIRTNNGPRLLEVNKAPDICMFNAAAGFDIASKIAEKFTA